MRQLVRWITIGFFSEGAAMMISVGTVDRIILLLLLGLNFAFVAAFLVVLDHEARGRGQ